MSYANHVVIAEDTLQAIAQRYLGDASRWMEIAILNDLEYPYLVDNERDSMTSDYVRALGENLLVPIEETLENAPIYELQQGYERVLGEDFDVFQQLLNPYGDSFINLTDIEQAEITSNLTYGDIRTVKGFANLRQALLMRLMTPEGTRLYHPGYGSRIHQLLGQRGTINLLQKLRIELERVIRSDGRVEDVTIDEITLENQLITTTIHIKPIGLDRILELGLNLKQTGVISWA